MTDPRTFTRFLRELRQVRRFRPEPVPEDVVQDILEVARWTGSSKNSQPWHFLVIRDPQTMQTLSELGNFTAFVAGAPMAIAVVMNGVNPRSEPYDQGRVEERIMLAAKAHGLGSGTAWYEDGVVNELLGIPEPHLVRSIVALGYPDEGDQRARSVQGGRRSLDDLVRYERFGDA